MRHDGLNSPLNKGLIAQMERGPMLANCPNVTSRQKSGMPMNTRLRIYGMRNAPETHNACDVTAYVVINNVSYDLPEKRYVTPLKLSACNTQEI